MVHSTNRFSRVSAPSGDMRAITVAFAVILCVVFACKTSKRGDGTERKKTEFSQYSNGRYDEIPIVPVRKKQRDKPVSIVKSQDHYDSYSIDELRKILVIGVDGFADYDRGKISAIREDSNLVQLIKSGVKFKHGVRPIFPTMPVPNFVTIATGLYADEHGVVANRFRDPDSENEEWLDVEDPVEKIFRGEPIWETLRKNDLKAACLNWPGCEFGGGTFVKKKLSWEDSIKQASEWLVDPEMKLVMMRYSDFGEKVREFGPGSTDMDPRLIEFDEEIRQMMAALKTIDPDEKINIIIVGTNGVVYLEKEKPLFLPVPTIRDGGLEETLGKKVTEDDYEIWAQERALWLVHPKKGMTDKVFNHFEKEGRQKVQVWKKADVLANLHYKGDRIPEIVISADLHHSLYVKDGSQKGNRGCDGYIPNIEYVDAALVATGPAIKPGSKVSTMQHMVNVHLLLCKILGVEPPAGHKGSDKGFNEFLQDRFLQERGQAEDANTE